MNGNKVQGVGRSFRSGGDQCDAMCRWSARWYNPCRMVAKSSCVARRGRGSPCRVVELSCEDGGRCTSLTQTHVREVRAISDTFPVGFVERVARRNGSRRHDDQRTRSLGRGCCLVKVPSALSCTAHLDLTLNVLTQHFSQQFPQRRGSAWRSTVTMSLTNLNATKADPYTLECVDALQHDVCRPGPVVPEIKSAQTNEDQLAAIRVAEHAHEQRQPILGASTETCM